MGPNEPIDVTHGFAAGEPVPLNVRPPRLNAEYMREAQWAAITSYTPVKAHCVAIDTALAKLTQAEPALILPTSLEYSFTADEKEGQAFASVLCQVYARRGFSTTYTSREPLPPANPMQGQHVTVKLSWK